MLDACLVYDPSYATYPPGLRRILRKANPSMVKELFRDVPAAEVEAAAHRWSRLCSSPERLASQAITIRNEILTYIKNHDDHLTEEYGYQQAWFEKEEPLNAGVLTDKPSWQQKQTLFQSDLLKSVKLYLGHLQSKLEETTQGSTAR